MSAATMGRDYSLVGPENAKAVAAGLAAYREILPALARRLKDPGFTVRREPPARADRPQASTAVA